MTHAALTLLPGVNKNRTVTLNEAAISESSLIRFVPDDRLGGVPQKLGGWTKKYPNAIGSTIRALWAWGDINNVLYMGVGAESSLNVINYGTAGIGTPALSNITPGMTTTNPAVSVTTTLGSSVVVITDVGSNVTNYVSVFIATEIAVGGLVLYGLYQCTAISPDTYSIVATDRLGNPLAATANVANGGAVPTYNTTVGVSVVTVNLTAHGYNPGDTYPAYVSTSVGGVTIYGDYLVLTVPTANTFTIQGSTAAASTAGPTAMNGALARYIYLIGSGPLPGGTGFGVGGFGRGGFGTGVAPTASLGTPITTTNWWLDNWGSIFLACPLGGAIYQWNPLSSQYTASAIAGAPPFNNGMFVVMPNRQIVAYGSTFTGIIDPLLVRWCDIGNYNQWIALVQNQAGSFRLTRGSKIVGGIQAPQQGLLWTDVGLWDMQYVGQPDVFSFNEIGIGCGLIGSKAAGSLGGDVFWMGPSQFYTLGGSGVETLYCPIWDVVFQELDTSNLEKIRFAANSRFDEVAWFIPTTSSGGEVGMYVKYNVKLQVWDYGQMSRTAWINQTVLGNPIGAGTDNYIYQHETSNDADGQAMVTYFQSGYFSVSEGDWKVFIDQVWPDMKWGFYNGVMNANVQITFYTADYPGDTPTVYGPYTVTKATQFITPRFRARLVAVRIGSSDIGSFWRLGKPRYRTQPDGKYY